QAATLLDCGPQLREQPGIIADEVMAIGRLARHIGFTQEARTNAVVKPLTGHAERGRETVNGPQTLDFVRQAMLMVAADPVLVAPDLEDGLGQDAVAPRASLRHSGSRRSGHRW